jgi:calcyclin binding protein
VKGEYSYESWQQLTAKKSREETAAKKKDPTAGIMDMMKDMYDR